MHTLAEAEAADWLTEDQGRPTASYGSKGCFSSSSSSLMAQQQQQNCMQNLRADPIRPER